MGAHMSERYKTMTKKEIFIEMRTDALSTYGKYDFIMLSSKTSGAKLSETTASKIKNARVYVVLKDSRILKWEVENNRCVAAADNLMLCIRSPKKMAMCLGNPEDEDSYFFFKEMMVRIQVLLKLSVF